MNVLVLTAYENWRLASIYMVGSLCGLCFNTLQFKEGKKKVGFTDNFSCWSVIEFNLIHLYLT